MATLLELYIRSETEETADCEAVPIFELSIVYQYSSDLLVLYRFTINYCLLDLALRPFHLMKQIINDSDVRPPYSNV